MSQTQDNRIFEGQGNQEDAESSEIRDLSSLHKYRTEMPNIIDELELDPYEYRLYCKYKRIAGDQGMCIKSNRKLADECKMSVRKLQQVKKSLTEPQEILGGKSLITITERRTAKGDPDTDLIQIVDIWPENFLFFIQKRSKGSASRAPGVVHQVHEGGASHAPKEELTKEEPKRRTTTTSIKKKEAVVKPQENSSSPSSSKKDLQAKLKLLEDLPINEQTRSNMCRFSLEVIRTAIENTKKSNPRDFGAYLYDQANKRYPAKKTQADVEAEKEANRRKQEEKIQGMCQRCNKIHDKVSREMPSGAAFNVHENGVVMKLPTDRGYLPLGFLEAGFWCQIENFLRKLGFTPQEVMG